MMKFKANWIALTAVCLVAACGGGGGDIKPQANINSVKVVGDSLSDSGTFGYKFTVQGAAATGAGSSQVWPERIATSYSQTMCNHYASSNGVTFSANASCNNYAVAGSRINHLTAPNSPSSVLQQLQDLGGGGFVPGDLVLVGGGANDAADLIGAYLRAATDGGASYVAVLRTVLDTATVNAALAGGSAGLAAAGNSYMKALAGRYEASIQAQALDKGAPRLAVLNIPDITVTPRFRLVIASISARNGAAAAAQSQALFKSWIESFNNDLSTRFAADKRVAVVDFYSFIVDNATNPASYALTNVKDASCPATGVDADGLPTYSFPTCTAASLGATPPPAGAAGGADWWKSYGFSDSFHPTPFGHQLVSQLVARSLAQAGWL